MTRRRNLIHPKDAAQPRAGAPRCDARRDIFPARSQAPAVPRQWGWRLGLRERGSDMRRHVVGAFAAMDVTRAILGRDLFEKSFKICPDVGVGVFLNEQRRGGVTAENRQKTGGDLLAVTQVDTGAVISERPLPWVGTERLWTACRIDNSTSYRFFGYCCIWRVFAAILPNLDGWNCLTGPHPATLSGSMEIGLFPFFFNLFYINARRSPKCQQPPTSHARETISDFRGVLAG